MRTKKFPLTADLAGLPGALPVFLRASERPPRYRWWRRLADRWAGRRDRTPLTDAEDPLQEAASAWLQQLVAQCEAAVAEERSTTEALIAVLDDKKAGFEAAAREAEAQIVDVKNALEAAHAAPDRGLGAGEKYSPAEERQTRLTLERRTALARLTTAKTQAEERRRTSLQSAEKLDAARHSHWTMLQERSRLIVTHHQQRASAYAGGMSQPRKGVVYLAPAIPIPEWATAELSTGGHTPEPASH
ncbi:MAG TPA: hypothetical protein PKE40_09490 [Arachnia sp.]|nr:hypothetical protein [Arachnia sp.]HMT86573.1 hypothetical protein [Arachnia sp.]